MLTVSEDFLQIITQSVLRVYYTKIITKIDDKEIDYALISEMSVDNLKQAVEMYINSTAISMCNNSMPTD